MRQLSARAGAVTLCVLVGLACSDDSNGPMDPEPGPDEERIAFSSDRDGDFDIYVMNVDGTEVEQLTDDPGRDVEPDWSPDGSRIVFASDRGNDPEFTDIWVMHADGSGKRRLTYFNEPGHAHDMGQAVWAGLASYSPDGTRFIGDIQLNLITQEATIKLVTVIGRSPATGDGPVRGSRRPPPRTRIPDRSGRARP